MENPDRNGSSGMRGGGQGRGLPGRVGQGSGVPQGMDRPMDVDGRDMGPVGGGNFNGRDAAVGMGGRGEGMRGRAGGDMGGQADGMRGGYGDRRMWAADGGGNGGKGGMDWWNGDLNNIVGQHWGSEVHGIVDGVMSHMSKYWQ